MPIYHIKEDGHEDRLVKAISSTAAIAHVVQGRFVTTNVKKPDDIADLIANGMTIEVASLVEHAPATSETPPVTPPDGDSDEAEGDSDADAGDEAGDTSE